MTEEDIQKLSKEQLQDIVLKIHKILTSGQKKELRKMIKVYKDQSGNGTSQAFPGRMSDDFVKEKMMQIQEWEHKIDEGELYLNIEEYEDYSDRYWDPDWIIKYYDNQGIGDKIQYMIQFAADCIDDRRYQEAHEIYEWIWQMSVSTECDGDYEYIDADAADLEVLEENNLIHTDMKQLALLTLYADYQCLPANERASDIYGYFAMYTFSKLHLEEMFRVGRESLLDTEQFWTDWIELLEKKSGDTEARLLKEAVMYQKGINGLCEIARESVSVHPSLYLAVMEEYVKLHLYHEAENMVYKRADAIVSGKYRNHYAEVAVLLAIVAEIKEVG